MNIFRPYTPTFIITTDKPVPVLFDNVEELREDPWVNKFADSAGFTHFSWEDGLTMLAHIFDEKYVVGTFDKKITPVVQWK